MRLVKWTDNDGYDHLAWVKNNTSDLDAPEGLPADPPDIHAIDWDEVKKELHNQLVERQLIDWEAVCQSENGLNNVILSVLKRRLQSLYR